MHVIKITYHTIPKHEKSGLLLNVRLANSHLWFVYETAKDVSRRSRGGPSGDQYSWLVGVTDKIVQGLLQPNPKAFSGLYKRDNTREWADNNPFRPWKNNWPGNKFNDSYGHVVATKDGWENVRKDLKYGFVCHLCAGLPPPTITVMSSL